MAKLKKTIFRVTFEDGATRSASLQPRGEKKKCIIKFKAANSDIENGIFGFDKIPKNYDKKCTSDLTKLENEYPSLTVETEKYFPAWVSMRKDQTITLDIDNRNSTIKQKEEYENIAFEEHPDFTIIPTDKKGNKVDLKDAKKIKITCKNTNPKTALIKVIADGKDAGAINFWYPKPKTIDLKWYFVEITGSHRGKNVDENDLKDKIKKSKLEALLKKGLNPALIDVNILNETAEIIDITQYRDGLKNRKFLSTYQKTDGNTMKYIERGKNGRKAQRVFSTFNLVHTKDDSVINLYCVNRKCMNTADIVESGEYLMAGGLSPVNTGIAYMVLDDNEKMLPKHIIHEILHSLGLEHTFSTKAVHTFKDKKTKNYMDYSDTRYLTYKWQWEKLHTYSHLK